MSKFLYLSTVLETTGKSILAQQTECNKKLVWLSTTQKRMLPKLNQRAFRK